LQKRGRALASAYGQLTYQVRSMPDFIVIGAQRCGTTSLFRALMAHPQVMRPVLHKGVNYFDVNYHRGSRWYQGHFPLKEVARRRAAEFGPPSVFEASGYYLYHPFAAERIARDLPSVKLVAMIRNPVERAYSAYKHELARGYEWETFDRALDLEGERLQGELERMTLDPTYESFTHRHHSYTRRGEYARQLSSYIDLVGRDRLLVIESESFFSEPAREFQRLESFLGLTPFVPTQFARYNARPDGSMAARDRKRLQDNFASHDADLSTILGRPPAWSEL
jgi:Sulfotransferase domain